MSQRTPLTTPHRKPPTDRLAVVLAAGIEHVSIDAKSNQLYNKVRMGGVKPGQGVKKPDSVLKKGIQQAVKKAELTNVTLEAELAVMTDCFKVMEAFMPSDGSIESMVTIMSVGAIRYFELNGLFDPVFAVEFYQAANSYLSYLLIAKDLPSGASLRTANMPTGSLFDDKTRGQTRRAVFADQTMTALLQDYFSTANSFRQHVREGEWGKVKETVTLMLPSLFNLAFGVAGYLPEGSLPGVDVLRSLNTHYEIALGQAGIPYWVTLLTPRKPWTDLANTQYLAERSVGTESSRLGRKIWDVVSGRDLSGGLSGIVLGSPDNPENLLEGLLRKLWSADVIAGPIGRILINLGLVVGRGVVQASLYQVDSVRKYIEINSRKEGRQWNDELAKAADLKVGLRAEDKIRRKTEANLALKLWRNAHKPLSKAVKIKRWRKDQVQLTSLIGRIFSQAQEAKEATRVAFQYQIWRNGINEDIIRLDKAITTMTRIQASYTAEEMAAARQAIVAERAAEAARRAALGEFPLPDEDSSDEDEDPPSDEEAGGANPFAGLGPLRPQ